MSDTLAVLALDAADYRLARHWDCENILLDDHGSLETFTYSMDHPFTPEVWTSVATGTHPREHEVRNDAADWDSLPLRLASNVTQFLPSEWRNRLGKPFRERGHEQQIHQTDESHLFEDGKAFGWPGVTEAENLSEAWGWASKVSHGEMSEHKLRRRALGNTGKELGWLVGMEAADVPIAGVHSHVLDITGHAYALREEKLESYYNIVDNMIGELRDNVSELVILSDHGMQTAWLEDGDPGAHSMRALVSRTDRVSGSLPESVFGVREWLETNVDSDDGSPGEQVTMDAAEERLRELGYIE